MSQYAGVSRNKAGARPTRAVVNLAIAAIALVSLPAFATLGGNSASVTADQAAMQSTMTTSAKSGYTDYALTLANGIVVHEFVNSANQVFEVTWYGKAMRPNMKQILGSYFSHFGTKENTKVSERRPTNRHLDRVEANFEVHSAEHNRLFSGTVHIPSMIPASMSGPLSVPESVSPGTVGAK